MQVSRLWLLVVLTVLLSGCGYNTIQQKDEAVKAGWSEVLNQYKRRADLIPNLVKTVQGYAQQDSSTVNTTSNHRRETCMARHSLGRTRRLQHLAHDHASIRHVTVRGAPTC